MPAQPAIPPLLAPYVSPPPRSSLTLVTSVLGATGNWLVLRFLFSALSAARVGRTSRSNVAEGGAGGLGGGVEERGVKVVLVSFLRSWDFWRAEAKRLGLDLARLADQGRFAFVDGLSELFYSATPAAAPSTPLLGLSSAVPSRTTHPVRSQPGPVPARSPPAAQTAATNGLNNKTQGGSGPAKRLHLSGSGVAALDALEKDILAVVDGLKTKNGADVADGGSDVLLVIDQPDLLLATTGPTQGIGATEMGEWIMGLEQRVYATILTLSSDSPLIHNAPASAPQQATPLEMEHAAFVIGMAHQARTVMQLRNLDTGAAKDVSGVLRISKGGAWEPEEQGTNEGTWEEKEVLYFVQRDAGVIVFGRGE